MEDLKLETKTDALSAIKRRLKKAKPADIIFVTINTIILSLAVIITLYPILNTLAVSFNDGLDALRGGIYLLPRKFSLKNYETVFNLDNLRTGAINTVLRTIIASVVHLSVTALLAYVLSIKEFVFRKQVSLFFVLTMYVNAGLIPTFLLYKTLNLTNTFWIYVVQGVVAAFNLLVLRTYMGSLPDSLRESAQIDGANHLTIFWKIYVPICKPVFATIALFIAVYHWSAWFDTMLYNPRNPDLTTLQYELMKLLTSVSSQTSSGNAYGNSSQPVAITPASIRAAATIVTSMPVVVLYPFLQRYFITGLTIGGVKE
jgi:putative aldouronate transport system permease protein